MLGSLDLLKIRLRSAFADAAKELYDIESKVGLEPADPRFADIQTNLPFTLVKIVRKSPKDIGQALCDKVSPAFEKELEFSVVGGFLNLKLTPAFLSKMAETVKSDIDSFVHSEIGKNEKINIEFVSANPTGPLNVVSARAAAIGDTLARLKTQCSWDITTEYYNNDTGNQVTLLGESFKARMDEIAGKESVIPEGGYHGEYLVQYAKDYVALDTEQDSTDWILNRIITENKAVLKDFLCEFDVFFSEKDFRASDAVEKLWKRFKNEDVYEKDGATWFRASEYDNSIEDYVLRKSDGSLSYIIVDIAYNANKLEERGFDRVNVILGPDHHNHAKRVEAALKSIGLGGRYDLLILQQVNLFDGGEAVKMSKRAGKIIPMSELLNDIGKDVARYFFLQRRIEAHLDFDLQLARKQGNENPIYYIQYAYARIANVLKHAEAKGFDISEARNKTFEYEDQDELDVLRKIGRMPEIIQTSAKTSQPHLIAHYLHELAGVFHPYYYKNQIVTADKQDTQRRLSLSITVGQAIKKGLWLMGIDAPESM